VTVPLDRSDILTAHSAGAAPFFKPDYRRIQISIDIGILNIQ
jgi:hypothetical protein